jgi:hypothetical protein
LVYVTVLREKQSFSTASKQDAASSTGICGIEKKLIKYYQDAMKLANVDMDDRQCVIMYRRNTHYLRLFRT